MQWFNIYLPKVIVDFCNSNAMVEINNLTNSSVDKEFLKRVAKKVLKRENTKEIDLSIVLVGQERMRKLNKKYRRSDKVTDVLSFGDGLNEIVICLREVKKNAKKYHTNFKKELARILIHGILHLLGEDHEKSKTEARRMEKKQDYYLSKV